MKHNISFAQDDSSREIESLRKQEYSQASGYSLDLDTLRWNVSDSESYVMIAKDDDQIVSTMRAEVINDISLLEKKLECPWHFSKNLDMPVMLLSRAATAKSHQSQGLNLILRYWFLKMAILYKIPFLVGTFVSGSPRQNTLIEMGYEFFENSLGWQQSSYRSHRPVIVAILDIRKNGQKAMDHCLKKMKEKQFYNLTEGFPELRYVRNL